MRGEFGNYIDPEVCISWIGFPIEWTNLKHYLVENETTWAKQFSQELF